MFTACINLVVQWDVVQVWTLFQLCWTTSGGTRVMSGIMIRLLSPGWRFHLDRNDLSSTWQIDPFSISQRLLIKEAFSKMKPLKASLGHLHYCPLFTVPYSTVHYDLRLNPGLFALNLMCDWPFPVAQGQFWKYYQFIKGEVVMTFFMILTAVIPCDM